MRYRFRCVVSRENAPTIDVGPAATSAASFVVHPAVLESIWLECYRACPGRQAAGSVTAPTVNARGQPAGIAAMREAGLM
jgi:hypothetical protein